MGTRKPLSVVVKYVTVSVSTDCVISATLLSFLGTRCVPTYRHSCTHRTGSQSPVPSLQIKCCLLPYTDLRLILTCGQFRSKCVCVCACLCVHSVSVQACMYVYVCCCVVGFGLSLVMQVFFSFFFCLSFVCLFLSSCNRPCAPIEEK